MVRKKVKQFSAPGLKTASISLKNPKGVRGRGSMGVEGQQGVVVRGQRERISNGQKLDKRYEDKGGTKVEHQQKRGPYCTVKVYKPEESEGESQCYK